MIVWLASYPKSGNTFLRSLLSAYFYSKDGNFEFDSLAQIPQFPGKYIYNKFGFDTSNHLENVKNYINVQKKINAQTLKTMRFLKTHTSFFDFNGYKFTDLNNTLGVIYIVRDPRSVARSYANHNQLSLESATDQILKLGILSKETKHSQTAKGEVITHMGSWRTNYNTWKEFKRFNRYFLVKYEDLASNTEQTFNEVLKFIYTLGNSKLKIDNKRLKNTLKSTTFDKMQKLEKEKGFIEAITDIDGNKVEFFKYGLKKNNPNLFPKNLNNKIKEELKEELKELNYI